MYYSYEGLDRFLSAEGITKTSLAAQLGISSKTIAAYHPETVEDIIAFHHDFESIHPFQDGNGRVGRLIALKECLHYGVAPFIIEDAKKAFYYRGLAEWEIEKGYLIDTCLDGQDTFRRLLAMLDVDV